MLAGRYFDGRSSRAHAVQMAVQNGHAVLSGDVQRSVPLSELHVSERVRHAPRKVTFPDGAYFEADDQFAFSLLLEASGHRDSGVVLAQQSWRLVAGALALTIIVLAIGYFYGLPAFANAASRAVPATVEKQLGSSVLQTLDRQFFMPSELPVAHQQAISKTFAGMRVPHGTAPAYQLLFRKSRVGPNAFALPGGAIVMTDQMVELLEDEHVVAAVLAHELGHLQERHMLKRLIQTSIIAAASALLFGDASGLLGALPALALDMRYSREAEAEADSYAAAMLLQNGRPLTELAAVFTALEALERKHSMNIPYLGSHPPSRERLERVRGLAPKP